MKIRNRINREEVNDAKPATLKINDSQEDKGWLDESTYTFYPERVGWSELPEPRWENVTTRVEIEPTEEGPTYILCDGEAIASFHTGTVPHKADLYDLPEDWRCQLKEHLSRPVRDNDHQMWAIEQWIDQSKTSAIQIHRQVEG